MEFHALGGLTITENGDDVSVGGARQRRLVAMLLIHRNTVVSVDRLADAVFAGEPTNAAATTLRSYVGRLRKVIDADGSVATLVTQAPGYSLRLRGDAFDVDRFEALMAEGGARLDRDDAAGASPLLREALALWRGEAYAEFADEDWARPEAQRLGELRLVAHERWVDGELACGRPAEVIPQLESLIQDHPLREKFRSQLMIALYRTGRHADALRVLRDYRRVLVDELGLEPSPGLVELEQRILTHDSGLLAEPSGLPLRGYRLGERLGTGRDGTVHAARLPGVDREFAIRAYREEIANRPEFVRAFEPTAQRVASLGHPAVVPIHDYWREPGAAYVVMRRMSGGTLADRLHDGPLPGADVGHVVDRIGGALVAAAEHGIVHGRVTPDSVLYDATDNPYLADFTFDTTHTASDDVHDFADMVSRCVTGVPGPATEVLLRGLAAAGRPSMAEFVPMVAAALTGAEAIAEAPLPNPYKGLRAFDEADAADFFGRADLVGDIVARLARADGRGRLVLVVGGSGTGKSSVVRAGLLPRVRRGEVPGSGQWFISTMLPGSSPFKELAESLRRVAVVESTGLVDELASGQNGIDRVVRRLVPDDGELLLVVDQFEELFTLAAEQDQRAFLDGLMYAITADDSRLRVVATLRADFYDRPLAVQGFGAAVNEATITIPPMSPSELEAAVVEPAERIGGQIERALVAELVSAVAHEPAALPSLQFALYELAERSQDKHLTLRAYRELGGVDGAIASRAELLYRDLDDGARAAVRSMFERLVVVGSEGEPTRRRAARTELSNGGDPSVESVIDGWAQARLLTLDRHPQSRVPTVELAHEALLREWPRLRSWIDEDRAAIVALGQLREDAASWIGLDRDRGALYRGARLEVALDVAAKRSTELPEAERQFLDASRDERDREQREAADRVARQARANRRLRIQLGAIGVALVVALVGGFIALDQRREAQGERRIATARELAAAADASLDTDPERSILLALAAVDETRSSGGSVLPEAEEALHRAVTASRIVLSVPGVGGELDWSPDGTIFVTEGPENTGLIDIRDAETGDSVRSWRGHGIDVNDVAFNSDGSMLATTGDDDAVRVWDPATGEELWDFRVDGGVPWGPSFSPDGSRLAASWWFESDLVRVFDLTTGELVTEIETDFGIFSTAFSADGERVALASEQDPTVTVVDADSGQEVFTLHEETSVRNVEWSPDGRWIATTQGNGTASIWDADTGDRRFAVTGHTGRVSDVDWSADGTRLATSSDDGTARVWEIVPGGARELLSMSSYDTRKGLEGVAFSPDGERLMASDWAIGAVTVWDASTTGGAEWLNVEGIPQMSAADFTADGRLVWNAGAGAVSVAEVDTGLPPTAVGPSSAIPDDDVMLLDVSGDGRMVATSSYELPVNVWDLSTGRHLYKVEDDAGPDGGVWMIAWSPDSGLLAVARTTAAGGRIVIVDRSGAEVAILDEEPGYMVTGASLSPDGRLLATSRRSTGRDDPTTARVRIWDWQSGTVIRTIDTPGVGVAFDPTGTRLATVLWNEGTVEVWDPRTGERISTLAGPLTGGLAYSHDGSRVATVHGDGTTRLWDPETGVQQLVLHGGEPGVHAVFSPDDSRLATVGDNGFVRVWALDLDDLIAIADERLTRGFADDECRQYLHVERCPRA